MSKHALVTGAGGFIGSHIVDFLLKQGKIVHGVDNLSLGRLENLSYAQKSDQFKFQQVDLSLPTALNTVLKAIHAEMASDWELWHLAANSDIRAGAENPEVDLDATFMTTYRALEIGKVLNVDTFYFSSSSAVYGEHDGAIEESRGPLLPKSNYGAMKLASEGIISAATEAWLNRAFVFRFPNVIGPRLTHGVIFDLIEKMYTTPQRLDVLGDGYQQKPYLHIDDLINAIETLVSKSTGSMNLYNIGQTDNGTTVKFIAEKIRDSISPGALIHYGSGRGGWVGDIPRFSLSVDALLSFGWKPGLSSDAAVEKVVAELIEERM